MSKKPTPRPAQTNTLFNYFSSPKGKVTPSVTPKKTAGKENDGGSKDNTPKITKDNSTKEMEEDSDDDIQQSTKKRHRMSIIDSDSDSDSQTTKKSKPSTTPKRPKPTSSEDESPKNKKNTIKLDTAYWEKKYGYVKSEEKMDVDEDVEEKATIKKSKKANVDLDSGWLHERLEFLKPDKIRDADKRKPSDPQYDPKTLYVPNDFLDGLTAAMRQWWILKSSNMDAVLFFKVGKFYELYHMDAVVGVQQLGFSYMKGEFAHSGFPESAYAKMATTLIDKGYKVARVEQTETPQMMDKRLKSMKKTTKFDKVVAREICQVSTKASCVYGAQMPEPRSEIGSFLYAISVLVNNDNTCRFGVCFIETSIGTFRLSEFDDDKHCSKLLSLFAEFQPGLILTERGANYGQFKSILNSTLKDVKQETLRSKTQFCSAADTMEKLFSACYFKDKDGKFKWPEFFRKVADECNPKPDYELCLKSLGAIHSFFEQCHLNIQLFSMGLFEKYEPIDLKTNINAKHVERDYMVLDATTIQNLSLLGGKGTLQKTLDFCKTPFGKRLLPLWICRPLCLIDKIKLRQNAVKELFDNPHKLQAVQDVLKKMPDLERQVAKIHTYGNKFCVTDHPDGRAIFYEAKTYSKRKIMDLLKTLRGFETSQEIATILKGCDSKLLKKLSQFAPEGLNVNLKETLKFFKQAFDHNAAEKEGTVIPKKGVEDDYDAVENTISEINKELKDYLKEQSKFFGCEVSYFGSDKKRFQLEVPEKRASKADEEYQLEGHKKGAKPCKRFSTPTTREFLQRIQNAEAERDKIILDLNRRIFEKFSQRYDQWQQVIHCLTTLDVLCSLAEYAATFSGDICRPNVEPYATEPLISIENGKHPCVANVENFVANDTFMGSNNLAPLLLLTGPNMGGKSTLMRQVSIISIMAQMGSYVPASQCSLSLIDRVFTRLGASDDIVRGQSTFFVELSEASTILRHASRQSLLIIDELGRGTSTHDGNAIATAYVRKLTEMGCRTLFSTHYHTLVDHYVDEPLVQLGHMACMVENDDNPTEESVTLLYKLSAGRCPKSFGFNAAKLAGLPAEIIARARQISKEVEEEDKCRNVFSKVFREGISVGDVMKMVARLDI